MGELIPVVGNFDPPIAAASVQVSAGDANHDLRFDQQDIVQVLQTARYLTGKLATFEQGDWTGDGVFDQRDIMVALQTGNYLPATAEDAADSVFAKLGS